MILARALFASLLIVTVPLLAHEGLHEQLEAMTKRIAAEPRNATLQLARGELYRLHTQWDLARADYAAAAELDPSLRAVEFARGRMELEAARPEVALPLLNRFLADHPEHGEAFLTRARAFAKLGRIDPAIADYDAAIAHTDPANPDLYYERARFLASLGATHIDNALRGLDDGLARFGMIPSLQRQAIDLARNAHRYDDALSRLTKLAAGSPRAETYLIERAEILEEAGRPAEAKAAYRDALDRILAGPRTARSIELTETIEKALARLERTHGFRRELDPNTWQGILHLTMDPKQIVHSDPEILGGTPVFVGTRVPVHALIDFIEGGDTIEDFLENYPGVAREQVSAFLEEARRALEIA